MLVSIEAFSKQREPRFGASSIIAQCTAALQTDRHIQILRHEGVGVWDYTTPIDLSAVTGGHWETRKSFDVTLAARGWWVTDVEEIATVSGTVNGEPFAA
jgi:hypothetical protein